MSFYEASVFWAAQDVLQCKFRIASIQGMEAGAFDEGCVVRDVVDMQKLDIETVAQAD